MTDTPVRYEVDRQVAVVTLDAPARRNALSSAMVDALEAALQRAGEDAAVRAVVLTHTGGTFCAGADLTEALDLGMEAVSARLVALLRGIVALAKPVVARTDGHVRAGGMGLVAACDLAVAGPASTFAFTESRLGLAPAIISLVTTDRLSSRAVSRYYLTGETFDARAAQDCGFVTVAAQDAEGATEELLAALRQCSPQGLAESKRLTTAGVLARIDAEGARLAALSAGLFASDEAREGMSAFAQRRPPAWLSTP